MPALIPVAMAIGSAAAGVYGAHKQSQSADKAAALQTTAANNTLDFQKQQAAQDQSNFNTTQRANYDQWAAKEGRMSSLGEAVGLAPRAIPAFQSQGSTQGPAAGGPAGTSGASAFLKGLLDKGIDPQQAAAQTNQQFKLGTGSQAVYYDASVHGTPVIGLPDSYIALEGGKWNVTQRGGGGGAPQAAAPVTPPAATFSNLGSFAQPNPTLAMPTPYAAGTLGAFASRR